jgi:hypothetical protein
VIRSSLYHVFFTLVQLRASYILWFWPVQVFHKQLVGLTDTWPILARIIGKQRNGYLCIREHYKYSVYDKGSDISLVQLVMLFQIMVVIWKIKIWDIWWIIFSLSSCAISRKTTTIAFPTAETKYGWENSAFCNSKSEIHLTKTQMYHKRTKCWISFYLKGYDTECHLIGVNRFLLLLVILEKTSIDYFRLLNLTKFKSMWKIVVLRGLNRWRFLKFHVSYQSQVIPLISCSLLYQLHWSFSFCRLVLHLI